MSYTKDETDFMNVYETAKEFLNTSTNVNKKTLEELDQFKNERHWFAQYCLDEMKGSRGRYSSAPSEGNHASILMFLNDGDRYDNSYIEDPHTLVKDLFNRQKRHINKWNKKLFAKDNEMNQEIFKLEQGEDSDQKRNLLKAARELNKIAYKRFKECYIRP